MLLQHYLNGRDGLFFLAFRPFGTILLFLTRVQTYAQKMKRCRAVFRRPSALLWPPHIV
jgi:hypothetical protein